MRLFAYWFNLKFKERLTNDKKLAIEESDLILLLSYVTSLFHLIFNIYLDFFGLHFPILFTIALRSGIVCGI